MENLVTYRVLVKYVDTLGRERRYSRHFSNERVALRYFKDKFDKASYCCDIYLYRICKKGCTTYCDVLRNAFIG